MFKTRRASLMSFWQANDGKWREVGSGEYGLVDLATCGMWKLGCFTPVEQDQRRVSRRELVASGVDRVEGAKAVQKPGPLAT